MGELGPVGHHRLRQRIALGHPRLVVDVADCRSSALEAAEHEGEFESMPCPHGTR